MERTKTGIEGFDKLIEGGIPKGKTVLLKGTPGTCKTIFAMQFIYNGAMVYGERGLYISFEERESSLKNQAKQFGWNIERLEKEGAIKILCIPPKSIIETTAADLKKIVEENKIQRLVIDSLSALAINTPTTYSKINDLTEISIMRFMYEFINSLRDLKVETTSLLIAQAVGNEVVRDSVSEFICDGIIRISHEPLGGNYSRSLTIPKMRETKNDEDVHPVEVTNKGLVIHDLNDE